MYKRVNIFPSIIVLIISILICLLFTPKVFEPISFDLIQNFSLLMLINVIIFFITIRQYYQSWINYDLFFILGFIVVHYQIPYLESIGIPNPKAYKIWINRDVVNYAIWLSNMFIFLWMLGFYFYIISKRKILISNYKNRIFEIKKKEWFNPLLLISFIVFYGLVGKEFWSGNHQGSDNWGPGATYAFIFVRTLLSLDIIYLFYNNKNPLKNIKDFLTFYTKNKLLFNLSLFYFIGFLLIGDRGPLMQMVFLYLFGYTLTVRKIKITKLLVMIVLGSFLMTVIGMGRTRDSSEREGNILTAGFEKFQENEDSNPTGELATSVRILYRALDVVPNEHPYLNGLTIAGNIIDVIPMSSKFSPIPQFYGNSTTFFTYLGQGPNPTYGEGSEIIGDLFINFGVEITLLISFIFGIFISYLTYASIKSPNIILLIIYSTLLIYALYINRSNFLMPLKIIVYLLIFHKLLTKKIKLYEG